MSNNSCDCTSVGVIIRDGNNFAVILRRNFPVSYAFVAGHCDGDSYEDAAKKEAMEEVGIEIHALKKVFEGTLHNACRRGPYHAWQVFEATEWSGDLQAGSDAKSAFWFSAQELRELAQRTESFSEKLRISVKDLARFIPAVTSDLVWQSDPGLEPAWYVMLKEIGII